jgi:hypothetical protein
LLFAGLTASDAFYGPSAAQADTSAGSSGPRILAIVRVKDEGIYSSSDPDLIKYDPASGRLSFPNPKHVQIVPVISDTTEASYIASGYWIKEIGDDYIVVKRHAFDPQGPPGLSTRQILLRSSWSCEASPEQERRTFFATLWVHSGLVDLHSTNVDEERSGTFRNFVPEVPRNGTEPFL